MTSWLAQSCSFNTSQHDHIDENSGLSLAFYLYRKSILKMVTIEGPRNGLLQFLFYTLLNWVFIQICGLAWVIIIQFRFC